MILVVRRSVMLFLALATAACALTNTGDPTMAAVVGGEQITASAVDEHFDVISESDQFRQQSQQDATGQLATQIRSQLLTGQIYSMTVRSAAERNAVNVDRAAVDETVDAAVEQLGGREQFVQRLAAEGLNEELFRQRITDEQLWTALQEQAGAEADFAAFVRDELSDTAIEINPRYGEWNPELLQVQPADPLAPADDAASPSPGQ